MPARGSSPGDCRDQAALRAWSCADDARLTPSGPEGSSGTPVTSCVVGAPGLSWLVEASPECVSTAGHDHFRIPRRPRERGRAAHRERRTRRSPLATSEARRRRRARSPARVPAAARRQSAQGARPALPRRRAAALAHRRRLRARPRRHRDRDRRRAGRPERRAGRPRGHARRRRDRRGAGGAGAAGSSRVTDAPASWPPTRSPSARRSCSRSAGRARPYVMVGNLPYYITQPLIRRFLEADEPPDRIVVLVQREVARRIVGGPGKESLLSLSVKTYGRPRGAVRRAVERVLARPEGAIGAGAHRAAAGAGGRAAAARARAASSCCCVRASRSRASSCTTGCAPPSASRAPRCIRCSTRPPSTRYCAPSISRSTTGSGSMRSTEARWPASLDVG